MNGRRCSKSTPRKEAQSKADVASGVADSGILTEDATSVFSFLTRHHDESSVSSGDWAYLALHLHLSERRFWTETAMLRLD